MRINGTGRASKLNKGGKARPNTGAGPAFSLDSGAESVKAAIVGSTGAVAGLDAILALQAVEDPLFAKRKTIKRGEAILDALEEMKADLLAGRAGEGQLNRLMALVQQAKVQSDPQLDALIEDIELRARVELAKLGYFPRD